MGKHRNLKLKRPSDNLPGGKLQEAWDKYLDAEVGRTGARPRWEVLMPTKKMDAILFEELKVLEQVPQTCRSEIYVKAFRKVITKLPLLQQLPIKYYFGIDAPRSKTEEEISEELGIRQYNISRRIKAGLEKLKMLIRKELAKTVREKLAEDANILEKHA